MTTIPRESIDQDAEKVVLRLTRGGFAAYLVGGCVRDLLLDRQPKDFDVSTSATPKEIRSLFRNCRIIGRRFRLAHIFFGSKIIETSTFRANPRQGAGPEDEGELLIRRDNVFGTDHEDARRRDFTINGLFYDVEKEQVIDYVGGLQDLEARIIRTIGDPDIRFREDPVRMLRAIKFAARLDFAIEPATYRALVRHRHEINKCAAPRVIEEFYRLMRGGAARRSLQLMLSTGVSAILTPQLSALFGSESAARSDTAPPREERPGEHDGEPDISIVADDDLEDEADLLDDEADLFDGDEADDEFHARPSPDDARAELRDRPRHGHAPEGLGHLAPAELARRRTHAWRLLDQLDELSVKDDLLSHPLILAAIVAPFVIDDILAAGMRPIEANDLVLEVLQPLVAQLHIARRDAERTRQIIVAQRRLSPARRRRGRPKAMARRDYFPEALALYEILAAAEGRSIEDIDRWRGLRDRAHDDDGADPDGPPRKRRRRRGGRRRRSDAGEGGVSGEASSSASES
jgi:poly(A) polymerase